MLVCAAEMSNFLIGINQSYVRPQRAQRVGRKRTEVVVRGRSITIACTDKARSVRFYQELLGAEPLPDSEGYGCPWFQLGTITFSLLPNASEPCPVRFPVHAGTMLWLETDDLEAAHRHLWSMGFPW